MKRLVFLFVLSLLCCSHVVAQKPTETEINEIWNRASLLQKQGRYQEALNYYLKVGEFTQKQSNEFERGAYVKSQMMVASCYSDLKQYDDAFQLYEKLLGGVLDDSDRNRIQNLYVYDSYAYAVSGTNETKMKRAVLEKIYSLADREMQQRILKYLPQTWYVEGVDCLREQRFHQALSCFDKACLGFHEVADVHGEMLASDAIGDIKEDLYDMKGALDAYKRAESLAKSDGNDVECLAILIKQLKLFEQLGDNESAAAIRSEIYTLAANSENDEVVFQNNMYLGDDAFGLGLTKLAEMYYLKNENYINSLGEDHRGNRLLHYLRLRSLCEDTEKLDEALKYHRLIVKERGSRTKEDMFENFRFLSDIFARKGDSTNCFRTLDTLFSFLELFTEPHEVARFYEVRGICYSSFKDYERVLVNYRKADEVLAEKYGQNDDYRVRLQLGMGIVEYNLGHYEESERLFRNYLEWKSKLVGENHIDYINGLRYHAEAEARSGHIEAACSDYTLAGEKLQKQVQSKLPYLAPSKREGYWNLVSKLLQGMTSFALKAEQYQTEFTKACYDGLVLSKAFLLASDRSTYDLIKNNGTEDDLNDYAMIAAMQAQVREWEKEGDKYVDSILFLISKIEMKETNLASRCRAFGNITTFMDWDYQTVKSKLRESDVLIDFTDFLSISDNQERIYAAYIINNEQEYPLLKRLFNESSIDSALKAHPDLFYDTLFSSKVYHILWEPFEKEVKEGATVYYVPSQLLFQVALESLPLKDGTLLGDHYRFIRLSSARELASIDEKLNLEIADGRTNAVLYGGLQYDVEAGIMAAEAKRYDLSQMLASRGNDVRGDSIFYELPWSKIEIDTIGKKLKEHGFSVCPYSGAKGTEESFLNLNGNAPQILHIATHGFYYTPDKAKEVEYLRGYEDAMSLSGLAMSGGNAAWRGRELPEGVLGGILTANDIAQLDLSGVDMVVLSACQSGNGKATSEGLYGLQRAFKKAGVKTMVMSLWDVQDQVGTEFMIAFYENLLGETGGDVRKALNAAKLKIREKYPEPYYWACFVALD